MIIFNATNFILDVQDRILMPRRSRDYPGLELHHLSEAEKMALEKGYIGAGKMPDTKVDINLKAPSHPIKISDIFK